MAPKGKKGKKGADDWDEGLGETVDPLAQAEQEAKAAEAAEDDEEGGGGLMAALKKNKEKRKKKGKAIDNEFLDGEDPSQQDGVSTPQLEAIDLSAKAPEEATMDDEDLFAQPAKGKKGAKGGKQKPVETEPEPADDDDDDDGGRVKTKAEKEKEKKEREKLRKKEQAAAKKKTAPPPKQEEVKAAEPEASPAPDEPEPAAAGGKKKKLNLRVAGATDVPIPEGREQDDIKPYVTCTLVHPNDLKGEPPKRKTAGYKQHKLGILHRGSNPPNKNPIFDEVLDWEYEDNDLAFVRILIKSDDKFASNPVFAVAAVRLSYAKPDWVFIRMLDLKGKETYCTLLVKFDISDA